MSDPRQMSYAEMRYSFDRAYKKLAVLLMEVRRDRHEMNPEIRRYEILERRLRRLRVEVLRICADLEATLAIFYSCFVEPLRARASALEEMHRELMARLAERPRMEDRLLHDIQGRLRVVELRQEAGIGADGKSMDAAIREAMVEALNVTRGNLTAAAKIIGVNRTTARKYARKFGLRMETQKITEYS